MSPTPACSRLVTRALPLAALGLVGIAFIAAGGPRYLTLAALAQHRAALLALLQQAGTAAPLAFIALYAVLTALSVPGAAVMSIAAGFLFGIWAGTLYAAIGATLGATAIFAAARAGFGNVAERAGPRLRRLEAGFRADALNYLLMLRLIPLFPFWLVNLVAAATRMRLRTYVIATFVGIVPGCLVFVSFGSGLDQLVAAGAGADPGIMLRPAVWLPMVGLAALALLPVAYRRLTVRSLPQGRSDDAGLS